MWKSFLLGIALVVSATIAVPIGARAQGNTFRTPGIGASTQTTVWRISHNQSTQGSFAEPDITASNWEFPPTENTQFTAFVGAAKTTGHTEPADFSPAADTTGTNALGYANPAGGSVSLLVNRTGLYRFDFFLGYLFLPQPSSFIQLSVVSREIGSVHFNSLPALTEAVGGQPVGTGVQSHSGGQVWAWHNIQHDLNPVGTNTYGAEMLDLRYSQRAPGPSAIWLNAGDTLDLLISYHPIGVGDVGAAPATDASFHLDIIIERLN